MNERTLLVVVDMQNDFVDGVLGTPEAQAIVPAVVEKIRQHSNVVFTADTHQEDYLSTQEGRNLPVIHCVEGTPGHALIPKLLPLAVGKPIIRKPTFGSDELGQLVRDKFAAGEIDDVTIIGLCTDICVISNAMVIKAFCPEIPITVDASCCAGVSPESHNIALAAMKTCQIAIV